MEATRKRADELVPKTKMTSGQATIPRVRLGIMGDLSSERNA